MDWFGDNAWGIWLGVALVLAVVEAASADLIFLMLAGGALAGMVAGLLTDSMAVQIVAASLTALALLAGVRPALKRRMLDGTPGAQIGVETYAGRTAVVVETLDEHDGRVRFDGEIWSARLDRPALPAAPGSTVRIVRVEGAHLVVEPVGPVQDGLPAAES